jgi:monofunctional biosynthetic peptidoglycan transglycosylase
MILAVIASEDQRFFDHSGFDLIEIEKAIDDIQNQKRQRGASTISQQVAKNLFLFPSKKLLRKGLELYFTVLIELVMPKKRILEIYLNYAEFGQNIYGVEEAAKFYFNKSGSYLNNYEAAMLAAVLPSPKRRDINNPSQNLINRKDKIIEKMESLGGVEYINQFIK